MDDLTNEIQRKLFKYHYEAQRELMKEAKGYIISFLKNRDNNYTFKNSSLELSVYIANNLYVLHSLKLKNKELFVKVLERDDEKILFEKEIKLFKMNLLADFSFLQIASLLYEFEFYNS